MAGLHRERSFGRDLAAVAGGVAVGVLGGRLVPPLLASAAGSMRSQLGHDPFERLRQDHRQIESYLERMRQAADDSSIRRGPLFVALKRTLGKHALAEEDVVYPLLHEQAGAADRAKQLYAEHAEMKVHLFELETALRSGAGWGNRLESLRTLIARHVRDEEDVEFPKLQALMDASRQRTIAGQIRREEAMMV